MASTAVSQQALAQDAQFINRLAGALVVVAFQVFAEDPGTAGHNQRVVLADAVRDDPIGQARKFAATMVMRTNLFGANTTYDFGSRSVVTDATDAAIQSQLSSDWSLLAGV